MPVSKAVRYDPYHVRITDNRYPNENVARNRGIVHPARFSHALYGVMAHLLEEEFGTEEPFFALDPFAGIGGIHNLGFHIRNIRTLGVEIESEWATCHPDTIVGDSRHLVSMFGIDGFDAVVTSPCLTPDQRLLTADMRWVPCGELKVGDRLVAFDEFSVGVKANGSAVRRRYRVTEVQESYRTEKECVRVTMENGDTVTCSFDHPWLADKYAHKTLTLSWVEAQNLPTLYDPHVLKQFEPREMDESWSSGWLAGIMEGEGSLSWGAHGAPKLTITQAEGKTLDRIMRMLADMGVPFSVYQKNDGREQRPCFTVFVGDGMESIVGTLGRFRPERLIEKMDVLDWGTRSIQPRKIRVVSVDPIGVQPIQAIQTSTRTYIGEGYLMHNTYGNRMADHFDAKDNSVRMTYKHTLGRDLSEGNTGAMHWGAEYRETHALIWREVFRVLRPGGIFLLNIKDHIRGGRIAPVTQFHIDTIVATGMRFEEQVYVPLNGYRYGSNFKSRMKFESVIRFRKPISAPYPLTNA